MNASLTFSAMLLTYAIHSTLLIGAVWVLVRVMRPRSPELRELLWKTALIGGVVTTLAQCCLPVPHWGNVLRLALPGSASVLSAPAANVSEDRVPTLITIDERPASMRSMPSTEHRGMDWAEHAISVLRWLPVIWLALCLTRFAFLVASWLSLQRLRLEGRHAQSGEIAETAQAVLKRFGCKRSVEIWITPAIQGPMVEGLRRWRLFLPESFMQRLDAREREAVIAHELAHLVRGDAWWLMAGQMSSCLFFFQPLNNVARRHLRAEAEYLADQRALDVLPDEVGLARSLVLLGEWLVGAGKPPVFHPLATGMGACRSILGKRIESLLEGGRDRDGVAQMQRWAVVLAVAALITLSLAAPRAVAAGQEDSSHKHQPNETMKRSITSQAAALVAGATLIAAAPAPAADDKPAASPAAEQKAALPEGLHGFSGHLLGKLISKDVEKGELVMHVNKLLHVWKNNKATKPEAVVDLTLKVGGIHGKALDVLVVLNPGDHFEIETKHVHGGDMMYLGEGIKKVSAPSEPSSNADARDALNGFRGMFVGKLTAKDQEKGTLEVKIARISKLWKQNTAKNTEAAIGQTWKINGVTGKWLDALLTLKVGDQVEVEAFHHRGDELDFVGEWLKKVEEEPAKEKPAATGGREDLNGFKGLLIGKLLAKDVEKGVVEIEVDTVKTVFKRNTAPHPESAVGQKWSIHGIAGKFLDNLLVINIGERIELAAFHNRGDAMDFPGELLRKAE